MQKSAAEIGRLAENQVQYCAIIMDAMSSEDTQGQSVIAITLWAFSFLQEAIFNDDDFKKLYSPVFIFDKINNAGIFAFADTNFIELEKNNAKLSVEKIL